LYFTPIHALFSFQSLILDSIWRQNILWWLDLCQAWMWT